MLDLTNSNLKIKYVEKDFPEISHQYLDSSKIYNDIGWKAKINLEDGLIKSIKSYGEIV